MNTWQRRTAYSLLGLAVLMLAYAVVYDYGMSAFENEPETFLHSLQVVVETFTTTGFGSDAGWQSPVMNVLVILMDLTGVALIFLALPVVVFPLLDETLSRSAPTAIEDADHVVIEAVQARIPRPLGRGGARHSVRMRYNRHVARCRLSDSREVH